MANFGWSLPPGAANDPAAPYNQDHPPLPMWCHECGFKAESIEAVEAHKHGKTDFATEPREYYEE